MSFGALNQPNILIIMTDQERAYRSFPQSFIDKYLTSMKRLRLQGMTFNNNMGNTMPCGPVRGIIFSGQYSHTNRVMNNGDTLYAPHRNFVQIFKDTGYELSYKGKYHLEQSFVPLSNYWVSYFQNKDDKLAAEIAKSQNGLMDNPIGLKGWTSPDFGTSNVESNTGPVSLNDIGNLGGGTYSNDSRIVYGAGKQGTPNAWVKDLFEGSGAESILSYLKEKGKKASEPWCLVASLLNPHDISLYPYNWQQIPEYSSFDPNHPMFDDFQLPESYFLDNLTDKPTVQLGYVNSFDGGRLPKNQALDYLKFYAYLHLRNEPLITAILDELKAAGLEENTLVVRMADHGEAGCSHFGLRQKTNNFYEECVNLPMVWSNPTLWPKVDKLKKAASSDDLVAVVDLVPTLAAVIGADTSKLELHGIDYSPTLLDSSVKTQYSTLFRFNVYPEGNPYAKNTSPGVPNIIAGIRTSVNHPKYKNYKYAVYYAKIDFLIDQKSLQFEMYDLNNDPNELTNLAQLNGSTQGSYPQAQLDLHAELTILLEKYNEIEKNSGWPTKLPNTKN